ncbi:MAG: citrate:H+ symporter [Lachnospiraceae bacterium]|nr:citrate:H+ symporter [Lachnospiraceae bacterium]
MSPTVMAIIMLVVVIACIIWNKIPLNFIMFVVPFVCCLLLGYSLTETSSFILTQINSVMQSAGYMLLFGLVYFTMLTETGMFDIIINALVKMIGNRLNVVVVMVMTSVIGAVGYLTANMSTTYLICFPIMIPMFKKFKLDQRYAFIICQTAVSAMCFLPGGIGTVNSAMMAGCSATELAAASMPWGLCFIPAIVLQWVYFAICHRKKMGTLGLPEGAEAATVETTSTETKQEEKPNARPKLFWFNLLVFVCVIVALAYFQVPSYLVFIAAAIITSMVNYPKNFSQIWNKAGATFFNVLVMLIAICFYLAVFNAAPEDGSQVSMVSALATAMTGIFPEFLMKYMFVIFLVLVVPIIHFVPYQVYSAMYPLFISVAATFGMGSIAVIAPFVCNLGLATSVTPMNSATYVGCTLCEIEDVNSYTNWGGVIMFFTNLIVIATALITGVLSF